MITREQFINALIVVKQYHEQIKQECEEVERAVEQLPPFAHVTKETSLEDCGISVRLYKILMHSYKPFKRLTPYGNSPIKELENLSATEFLTFRGAGKNALAELRELCHFAGIKLKP